MTFDVEPVLEQLTTAEKVTLLAGASFWASAPIERLNVPAIKFSDGPNGVRGAKLFSGTPGAVFPNGTGLASTFNKDLLKKAGNLMAEEARHKGIHAIFGPTANIPRGPNGGRGFESFSEDPYLSGISSASIITGIQSKGIAATMKHYVGNDLEHERLSSDSIISKRALREVYLEPFRLAIKNADPRVLMTGYNKVNGIHSSESRELLIDILREEWGWEGTTVSDYSGTYSVNEAIANGLDIELPGPGLFRNPVLLLHQLKAKKLHIDDVDARVRNVLRLASFISESDVDPSKEEDLLNDTEETASLLRQLATESIVLLKNESNILPLSKTDKIAIIGPNAKVAVTTGGGSASLIGYHSITPYDGIAAKLSYTPEYALGTKTLKNLPGLGPQLINPFTGEEGYNAKFYNEPVGFDGDRGQFDECNPIESSICLLDYFNKKIVDDIFYIDVDAFFIPDETGDYVFGLAVLGSGKLFIDEKLVVDNTENHYIGDGCFGMGTDEMKGTINLLKDHKYRVRFELGSVKTSSFFKNNSMPFENLGMFTFGVELLSDPVEDFAKAIEVAKSSDKVVVVVGNNKDFESEGFDRTDLELPGNTGELIQKISEINPNVVVVNQTGTPISMPWLPNVKGLLQAWFGGNELGHAIADVLFGDATPSGKLSLTFPKKFEDNPAYLNFHTEDGRVIYGEDIFVGYKYYEKVGKDVLFPFGYGLSYTTFQYSNLDLSVDEAEDSLKVSFEVTNTGAVKGQESSQVYISAKSSEITRPVKELKGFHKLELDPNDTKKVELPLSLKDTISYFSEYKGKWIAEKGNYEIQVGSSSAEIRLVSEFYIEKPKF